MLEQTPLTAMDRCDRCRAPACARTRHESGDLLWCRHHLQKHADVLTPALVFYAEATEDEPMKEALRS